ncbi:MAG: exodeoxyribonuclease VII small subunit [Eggerthellaceae bacterium]|nr:exodeoxyribonuclease VII small subunit [Eggerthellaceae bacterium]
MAEERETFDAVKTRLDEILEAVTAEDVSLDDALALYEEAVKLGLSACDLSEKDVDAALAAEVDAAVADDEPIADDDDGEAVADGDPTDGEPGDAAGEPSAPHPDEGTTQAI